MEPSELVRKLMPLVGREVSTTSARLPVENPFLVLMLLTPDDWKEMDGITGVRDAKGSLSYYDVFMAVRWLHPGREALNSSDKSGWWIFSDLVEDVVAAEDGSIALFLTREHVVRLTPQE